MKIEQMINTFRDLSHQINNVDLNLSCDIEYLDIWNEDFIDGNLLNETTFRRNDDLEVSYKLLIFRRIKLKLKFTEVDSDGDEIPGDIECEIERFPYSPSIYKIMMKFNTNELFDNKIDPLIKKQVVISVLEVLQRDLRKKISHSQSTIIDYIVIGLEEEENLLNIKPQELKYWLADISKGNETGDNKEMEYYIQSYCHLADITNDNKSDINFYIGHKEKSVKFKPSDLIDLVEHLLNESNIEFEGRTVTFDGHYIKIKFN